MEFCSKLEEDLMSAEELLFPPTPGFGPYRSVMPEEAVAHPAKMNTKLLEYLIQWFTKPGEIVLDPMAGTGSTGVVAALHGRNAVCVELEKKFYKWMEKARKNVERTATLTPKGKIVNICGDARKLSELLSQADVCITSPPYSEGIGHDSGNNASIEYEERLEMQRRYTRQMITEGNIAKLKHGSIDAIVTSPPFGESNQYRGGTQNKERMMRGGRPAPYSKSKENIGNLSYRDVDVVITSPPYSETLAKENPKRKKGYWKTSGGYQTGHGTEDYGENPENIGNLPIEYSENKDNIGKETYLEAMLKVYGEMWKVLRPDGLAIIVVKPFIRNKKVVDLPYHTWLLLKKVGFKLVKLYKLRLKNVSFWRILYEKKYPSVPKLRHEYVLVCMKATS